MDYAIYALAVIGAVTVLVFLIPFVEERCSLTLERDFADRRIVKFGYFFFGAGSVWMDTTTIERERFLIKMAAAGHPYWQSKDSTQAILFGMPHWVRRLFDPSVPRTPIFDAWAARMEAVAEADSDEADYDDADDDMPDPEPLKQEQ